ncbi:hypothetical protein ASD54_21870 [Rhizobium sp. Root149]|uniref:FAD-binding protein n=1 Tax=Rhizobium sp. Root149 TaxID=1736473 RepID=UPI0007150FFC|nr:FAD-binding protein [Rhizobium sp. Root149]KQZ46662.1 hypothetical protein ASD54_21870 [Rhizobium sp. Root149]
MSRIEVDVLVLGSGAAGLAAATVAARCGALVLLAEKEPVFGGSTAISGGVVWIPNNREMAKIGLTDSGEQAKAYLSHVGGNKIRQDLVDAFIANGPEMVQFMHDNTELRLIPRQWAPDYFPDVEGASHGGRSMDPQVYDGSRLGSKFSSLKWPLKEFLVFGGMMVGRKEIDGLLNSLKSPANFLATARMITLFFKEKLLYGRGTRLLQGNSLAAQLLKSAIDAKVELWSGVTTQSLEQEDGQVRIAHMIRAGRPVTVRARRGIVLAGGGAAADGAGMRDALATPDRHYTMAPAGNVGDLQKLAIALGARVDQNVVDPANYAPVSVMQQPDGREVRFPHLFLDRAKPGLIAVNRSGRRFVDEATSYHSFVRAMIEDKAGSAVPAWLVCDARFIRRYGMGLVRPGIGSKMRFIKSGYLKAGSSIVDLAAAIGVPSDALQNEVDRHNRFAIAGHDPDFGKGSNAYDQHQGDLAHKPNPCLGPISTAPFYAVKVFPGDIGSTRGLVTDASARVLDEASTPIAGLYACGNDMNSVMAGTYPGAGITLGPALTFGYIIGKALGTNEA